MEVRVLSVWAGATAIVAAALIPVPVQAQSNLSDQLARTMSLARKDDLKGEFGQAFVDPGRTLEFDPRASVADQQKILLRRASLFETIKDFGKAEAAMTAALELTAAPAGDLLVDRGYFYMRRGRYPDAINDFMTGARLEPTNPRFQYAVGRAQAALGNFSGAIDFYDEAIKLASRDATFYLARAEAEMHLDQPERAVVDYDRAIDLRPRRLADRYFAFLGRGSAFLKIADYRAAIENFDSALEIDPRAVDALLWRGYARELLGQGGLALDDYERAATVNPSDRVARANVVRMRSN